ncbi:hypothetical protein HKD37_09G025092 [Glycine soja]
MRHDLATTRCDFAIRQKEVIPHHNDSVQLKTLESYTLRNNTPKEQLIFDLEIEKTLNKNKSIKMRQEGHMDEETISPRVTLKDHATWIEPLHFNTIARPTFTNVVKLEMKLALIHLIQNNQFHRHSHENPYAHSSTLIDICITVKINHVLDEALCLCLFPFSLAGDTISWLGSFPPNSLSMWDDVVAKFLHKYFTSPTHGFDEALKINLFLGGLRAQSKLMLDALTGVKISSKTQREAIKIIKNMVVNANEFQNNRVMVPSKKLLEVNTQDGLLAQQKFLTRKIEELTQQITYLPQHFKLQIIASTPKFKCFIYESCGGGHATIECAKIHEESTEASIKSLDFQVGQLEKQLVEKNNKTFSVVAEENPKGSKKDILKSLITCQASDRGISPWRIDLSNSRVGITGLKP